MEGKRQFVRSLLRILIYSSPYQAPNMRLTTTVCAIALATVGAARGPAEGYWGLPVQLPQHELSRRGLEDALAEGFVDFADVRPVPGAILPLMAQAIAAWRPDPDDPEDMTVVKRAMGRDPAVPFEECHGGTVSCPHYALCTSPSLFCCQLNATAEALYNLGAACPIG